MNIISGRYANTRQQTTKSASTILSCQSIPPSAQIFLLLLIFLFYFFIFFVLLYFQYLRDIVCKVSLRFVENCIIDYVLYVILFWTNQTIYIKDNGTTPVQRYFYKANTRTEPKRTSSKEKQETNNIAYGNSIIKTRRLENQTKRGTK